MSGADRSETTATAVVVAEMGYCFRIPGCGCVVAAQVDEPEYAREVAKFKRSKSGFVLDHLPVEEIRALPWGWPCEHMKAGGWDVSATTTDPSVVSEP